MDALALIFVILFIASTPISFAKPTTHLNGLSIDLIHRDSPLLPFYNSSMTPSERYRNAALSSFSRSNHIHAALNGYEAELAETIILPSQTVADYFMRFYIGTPPVETYGIADTGSDLIWVQCQPCQNCYHQRAPIFNPKRSSTFKSVSCGTNSCSLLSQKQTSCGKSNECSYIYGYGDKSYTRGELAMESINIIPTNGGQSVSFPKSVFGCGYNNSGTFSRGFADFAGIVGLGGGPLSLVSQLSSQLGNKFSYCLVPPSSNHTSKLKFGNSAVISNQKGVVSTPLFSLSTFPTYHIIRLEGITVGQKTVKTPNNGGKGNIVIDSGSTLTMFNSSLYNQFEDIMKQAIGVQAVRNPTDPNKLCYRSNTKLPDSVFHFTNADVVLKPENLFRKYTNNLVCLAVAPTNGVPIYGNVAQINFEVEYDLDKKMVSFAPADCTK